MLNFFKKKNNQIIIKSPFEGEIVDITNVNDQMFSGKMLGDGVAVIPSSNKAVAPCDGEITQIFPTNHAFGITTKEGLEILVHIGIDTVNLKGEGFKRILEAGTSVKKGDTVVEADLDYIKNKGKDTITPIIITNMDKVECLDKNLKNIENVMDITLKK
ncbi:PTS sugar transporter subunit IIA [Tepidibacter aestuarii]|uniref:PTS sugar transporter subunit IIA n=1 Tax=Tepidibacter aestuarii TaxID=2925782 RepID=UPI0020BF6A08|nr:PTS glucose transporter subunit IIA [Tepidibacter aestuarii]CAH2214646.1 Enzyme IIA(Glc) [Tepidibacter aestuarii]